MATRRANDAARCSPATARRGRLSERAWADVRVAARVARETGVVLRLHGIEIYNKRKPHKLEKEVVQQKQQKPVEAAVLELPLATDGEAPPPPLSKRQRRSARRLQEFQEKKRAEFVAKSIAVSCEATPDLAPEEAWQRAIQLLATVERGRLRWLYGAREDVREAAHDLPADAAPADSPMDEDRNAKRGAELEPPHGAGKKSRG